MTEPCPYDTNGDGDCNRMTCARCHPEYQPWPPPGTLAGDAERLHREWGALKAAAYAELRVRWPDLLLIYLGILACVLLATLVTL